MKTHNSLDLTQCAEPCAMSYKQKGNCCGLLTIYGKECGSAECPFYKPVGCGDWVRIEDEEGITLVPPEEYYLTATKSGSRGDQRPAAWKIRRVRA